MAVDLARPANGAVLQRRYRLDARIASGGMGSVYRAWDNRLDRAVAVKVLHPHHAEDARIRERFRAEARHAARVRHPNVVAVIDQDDIGDLPFIVMELVDGPSLRGVLDRRGTLPAVEVAALLAPVCAGLGAVHDAGLVHRDVKPENLLVDARGVVRVADFGIARALDTDHSTPTGEVLGSVDYVAPEIVLGADATPASDQYSLGIVVFEALTGHTPLPAPEPIAVALRHAHEDVPAPSTRRAGISGALDAAVLRATARDPGARFAGLADFVAAVSRCAAADPPRPRPPSTRRSGRPLAAPDRPAAVSTSTHGAPPPAAARRATSALPEPHHPTRLDALLRGMQPSQPAPVAGRPPHAPGTRRAPTPTRAPAPTWRRARTSMLALVALLCSAFSVGALLAPPLAWTAMRRIDRSRGRLRGATIARFALVLGLLRLVAALGGW